MGKRKNLSVLLLLILVLFLTFQIKNLSDANVCCKMKQSFVYDPINKTTNHLVM